MDEKQLLEMSGIDADDWEQTPVSVREVLKQLVLKVEQLEQLEQRLKELEIENQQLREKINRNSENSHSPLVGADETGFGQGNTDGESFRGILNSDRYNAYNWVDVDQRQLCWAHLKREFTKISERQGLSRQLGRDLLAQQKKLFRLWHRVRDGTLSRSEFQSLVSPIRRRVMELLEQGANYQIGSREKTPLAKTVRTCRQLLKVEAALWLFVTVEGLEPTNNAAERAIRPAVLWRRTSFGSQSEVGSIFVSRMLTVVTSLRSQNRNVLEFMTEAIRASRRGRAYPSLLPQESPPTESTPLAA